MREYFDQTIGDYVIEASDPVWIVEDVQPQKDYTLLITFADGQKKVYNALPLLEKKIYSPLKNLAFFMCAKVSGGSVAWNDDIDIAPEHLYEASIPFGGVSNA